MQWKSLSLLLDAELCKARSIIYLLHTGKPVPPGEIAAHLETHAKIRREQLQNRIRRYDIEERKVKRQIARMRKKYAQNTMVYYDLRKLQTQERAIIAGRNYYSNCISSGNIYNGYLDPPMSLINPTRE